MQRQSLVFFAVALTVGAASALAQRGDLAGDTMRVLDDVGDVAAVILELDAGRAEGAESERRGASDNDARAAERDGAAGERGAAQEDRLGERRGRDELHDADRDERSEGRLEDRDVERPAVPPAPAP
jgi:hypothetical protein